MLIRETVDGTFECITQEHHALLSGVLAGAWLPSSLDPLLVQAIGMHDNPWRSVDRSPAFNAETGMPYDFVEYPIDGKIEFYRAGIDALEEVHPWIAHLVSRHYTTFAGTRDEARLTEPEGERRDRLESRLTDGELASSDAALRWMKYFDVFSLHLCLTGPAAERDAVPRWLRDPGDWSEAPDETPVELEWNDDTILTVAPWPFDEPTFECRIEYRRLDRRYEDAEAFEQGWREAPRGARSIVCEPG